MSRNAFFWQLFAQAKAAFLRTYHELSTWLDALYEIADTRHESGADHYCFGKLCFTVFQSAAAIVIYFDDGIVWYACTPKTIA